MHNLATSPPQASADPRMRQATPTLPRVHAAPTLPRAVAGQACECAGHDAGHDTPDRQFVAMLGAYRASGGLCRARELQGVIARAQLLAQSHASGRSDVTQLNGWIMRREVICFEWQASHWLPWFQFNAPGYTPHVELGAVLQELNTVCDPWEVGCWFARPNPWLSDRSPVDSFLQYLPDVLHAARAERFIAH